MKARMKEYKPIEDGRHTGVVQELKYRTEPYSYVDIVIKEDLTGMEIKVGIPFNVSNTSTLGRVLEGFGLVIEDGKEIEIEDYINKGLKVSFVTITEKTEKGTFSRIVSESLKPND